MIYEHCDDWPALDYRDDQPMNLSLWRRIRSALIMSLNVRQQRDLLADRVLELEDHVRDLKILIEEA